MTHPRPLIREDPDAVSPVIATILMVAITVVLAAVLYAMVSGVLNPVGSGPRVMGVSVTKTANGANWSLAIVSTPMGLLLSAVRLTIIHPAGGTELSKAFNALSFTVDRAVFVGSGTTVAVGDRLLIDAARYPTGFQVQVVDVGTILFTTTFG